MIVYTAANGGPWDNAGTTIVPNPGGPGTYFGTSVQFATVPIDAGGDIIIGKLCVTCLDGNLDADIKVKTVPGFDTVVGDSVVFDPQIAENTFVIDQFRPPCICTIAPDPVTVSASANSTVTQQFTVSENAQCLNNPVYVWTDTCTLGSVDQAGLLTVPATLIGETCAVCVTDTGNTENNSPVTCCSDVTIQPALADGRFLLRFSPPTARLG